MPVSIQSFTENLTAICPDFEAKKFLLAVSGGADSMVLASLFNGRKLDFQVAHINYSLRGGDSDLDQKTVEEFCEKNKIRLNLYKVSEAEKPENGIQLWARNLRYDYFFKVLEERNLDFLVTAHHLDDQLETFLINLSRGSGLRGLSGIPANENRILRPLLNFSKSEIYAFAEENSVEFREDLSNKKNDYLRNRFRNKIVPEIKSAALNFEQGFRDSVGYLKSANQFIQNKTEKALNSVLLQKTDGGTVLNKAKLLALDEFLITEIILKFGFHGAEIHKITHAENGKMFRSKTHEIQVTRDAFIFSLRRQL